MQEAPIDYSISKSALNAYVLLKSKDLARYKITLNLISPGNIFLKGNNWDKKINLNKNKVNYYIKKNVPLKKFISPEVIMKACEFIINDNESLLTGSNLVIDGGQSI